MRNVGITLTGSSPVGTTNTTTQGILSEKDGVRTH
jgi:hypothetical protein